MSNVYSLDDLRNDLDREFAPLKLDIGGKTVVLRNVLRLPKKDRDKVMEAMKSFDAEKKDDVGQSEEMLKTILGLAADSGSDALLDAIGDDLALAMKIMELWTEATQPGEARKSPDSTSGAATN